MCCVGIGAVGVVLPGLPTTIFLIAAAACFTRSCPWLEDRLLRNRLFAPYLRYVYGVEPMPRRARLTALAMMWSAVTVSLLLLNLTGEPMPLISATIVVLALVGTIVLLRYRRQIKAPRRCSAAGAENTASAGERYSDFPSRG